MNEIILQLNEFSAVWIQQLWQASWQGGVVLLLILAVTRLFVRVSAGVQCWLWRLALCKLVIVMVGFTPMELPWLPSDTIAAVPSYAIKPTHAASTTVAQDSPGTAQVDFAPIPTSHRTGSLKSWRGPAPRLSLSSWMLVAWLLGVTYFLVTLLRHWLIAHRIIARLRPVDEPDIQRLLEQCCLQLGVSPFPKLGASDACVCPCVIGFRRPVVVLPRAVLTSGLVDEQQAALAHELAHIQRRDLLWNWLPAVTGILFFFHPLVWLAKRELRLAQEIATDERVVSGLKMDVARYAQSLVRLIENCPRKTGHSQFAVSVSEAYSQLSRRVAAMQTFQPTCSRRRRLATTAVITIAVCGVIPWKVTAQEADAATKESRTDVEGPKDSESAELSGVTLADIIAGLKKTEDAVQNLSIECGKESSRNLTRPGRPLAEIVQGLIENNAVSFQDRSQCSFLATADGRFRNEVISFHTSQNFEGDQFHSKAIVNNTYDGKIIRTFMIRIDADGSVDQNCSESARKAWNSESPFDWTVHHHSESVSETLESHGAEILEQELWEGVSTLVVETRPFTRDNGYISKRRYWIDPSRGYLVVRRQTFQPQNDGKSWSLHHQIDGTQHKEVQPGLWLPMHVEIANRVVPPTEPPYFIGKDVITVSRWDVNEQLDPSRFRLEFPDDVPVYRN